MANTTFNPSDKASGVTLTGSNLIATNNNNTNSGVRSIDKQIAGKFYWECTCNVVGGLATGVGIATPTVTLNGASLNAQGGTSGVTRSAGTIYVDGVSSGSAIGAIGAGAVVGIAIDCDARLAWFRLGAAGNWNGSASANPATGAGGISIYGFGRGIPIYPVAFVNSTGDQITANFGDAAFVGAMPSGYTSGFTAGASVPTNALASQALAEHWLTTNPQAQITQVALEHWMSVAEGTPVVPSLDTRVMVLA